MSEIWKTISGTNDKYEISNYGNVRKKTAAGYASLHPYTDRSGYLRVAIKPLKCTVAVHRLVAIAFIPNPYNHPVVHHIDENKANNVVTNLLWCTHKQNRIFGVPSTSGKNAKRKTSVIQLDKEGNFIAKYNTFSEAARAIGFKDSSTIAKCAHGKSKLKTAYGYKWRTQYEDLHNNEALFDLAKKAYQISPNETIEFLKTIVLIGQGHL